MGLFDGFFKKKDNVNDSSANVSADNQELSQNEILSMTESMSFQMKIEDIVSVNGRGVAVTGVVGKGKIRVGDKVKIVVSGKILAAAVGGIEISGQMLNEASAGDRAGLLLAGNIKAEQLKKGDVVLAH
jgi:translation elongation factor EF-Tu-like GTPase